MGFQTNGLTNECFVNPQSPVYVPCQKLVGDHVGVRMKNSGDHLGVGIIWGSGSFRGQFGDYFGVGIISGAVQISPPCPSQCWLTRLARRIPKNNIERGGGGGGTREGYFRLGCEASQLNLTSTVASLSCSVKFCDIIIALFLFSNAIFLCITLLAENSHVMCT